MMLLSSELLSHVKVELPEERSALEFGVLEEAIDDEVEVVVVDLTGLYLNSS